MTTQETRGRAAIDPIIPNETGGRMGRIAPGSCLAVRAATEEELSVQWQRLHALDAHSTMKMCTIDPASPHYEPNPEYRLQANAWLVCWADDPSQVLHDWFSVVGHWLFEYAVEEAEKYARARRARYVGPLVPLGWEGDQA